MEQKKFFGMTKEEFVKRFNDSLQRKRDAIAEAKVMLRQERLAMA